MRRHLLLAAAILSLLVPVYVLSQSANATVGGTVQDPTGAFIPGVSVTATNTGTGIATAVVSNESGAYQFASLQPGTYEIKAELPGFQTALVKAFALGGAAQARLNFTLQVGAAAGTTVDVSIAADALLATSSNSIGTVLPEYKVRDLPLASRDVFGLVTATAGAQESGGLQGAFAGMRTSAANTTRDGVNVSAGRFEDGAWSLTYTSPDLVEEVKVVVAPVDAQASRGNGQVSFVTRSGGNEFHGSAFWANHNSALDASSWFNNFSNVPKSYDNRNQYGIRVSGPIVKKKTFFMVLFEGQRDLKRENATGTTLTEMARQGIFRFYSGVDNANFNNANPTVDRDGAPRAPNATAQLRAVDLFGNCTFKGAPVANCTPYRDPLRSAISNTVYMQETLRRMPMPNEFTGGDGLNTALIRFTRRVDGQDFTLGNGPDVNRDQYNIRIDHNFNANHKLSLIGTKEKTWGAATQAVLRSWPEGFDGIAIKRPDVYIMTFTSTLSSSLLNELRLGRRRSIDQQFPPGNRPGPIGEEALQFVPVANGVRYHVIPQLFNPFVQYGRFGAWRSHVSPMHSIGDDLSWTHAKHAFKGGVEFRNTMSKGFGDPGFTPFATLGAATSSPISGLDPTSIAGLTQNNAANAQRLLTDLSGSIASVNQSFGIMSSKSLTLTSSPEMPYKYYEMHQRELSAFFKDDWKFRPDLTLNIGAHWEYYGQPFEQNGLAARIIGDDQSAFFNIRCPSSPGTRGFDTTCTNLTQVQFVGKNSPNPDQSVNIKDNDSNNIGPAVGLAWKVPWFGKDKTVVRAGYGITYQGALRNFITVDNTVGTVPGINLVGSAGNGITDTAPGRSLANITLPIPLPPGTAKTVPFTIPTNERTLTISTYDRLSPYTSNWNLEVQREVARNTTVEVRYIGTKGTKLWGTINLNQIDALHRNKELFDAFVAVRNGQESPLLNQMLLGLNLGGTGAQTVNGTTWTGAMAVRANTTLRTQLANGSVGAFLNSLNTLTTGTGSTAAGAVLRYNGFPENYIVPNPQFSGISILTNPGNSTYHSMQLQFTRRLTNGFTNTTAWTWSKAIGEADGDGGATYRDPTNRSIEKSLLGFDRAHQLTSNGTYELPFGGGHRLLGNAPGWVQQIVNRWQLGGIMNFNSGAPLTITATGTQTISNVAAQPNIVGELPSNMGKVTKLPTRVVYFDGFTQTTDHGVSGVTTLNGLNTAYTNRAIVDPSGNVVLVNPQPGQIGSYGLATLKGPKSISLDMNLIKRFQIHENKEFELRIDAINVLNHPNFGAPVTNINGNNTFGQISTATGSRRFVMNTRITF